MGLLKRLLAITSAGALTLTGTLISAQSATAQGQGAAPVRIVEPLPVPVTDSTNPAYHAFQALLCTSGCQVAGPEPDPTTAVHVPTGSRMVIEYISAHCSSPATSTISIVRVDTRVGGVRRSHLPGPPEFRVVSSDSGGDTKVYTFGQMVRIYADPDTDVTASVDGVGLGLACSLSLSGHTVALQ